MDREQALRQTAQRADQVRRHAADEACPHEDRVDVPVGVVVGEDRLAQILIGARCLEVARSREDRVDRVVRVLLAVAVGVDAVGLPAGRDELHPAHGAGGRDVEVAAVVGLDLVDRGQDLPADAVLDARGLVDRQQERRDRELVDEEVRNADRHRAQGRQGHGRVRERRDAVGVTQAGLRGARALGQLRAEKTTGRVEDRLTDGRLGLLLLVGREDVQELVLGLSGRRRGSDRRLLRRCSRRDAQQRPAGGAGGRRDLLEAQQRRDETGDLDLAQRRARRDVQRDRLRGAAEQRDLEGTEISARG